MARRTEEEECPDCGYDWAVSLEGARRLVEDAPDRFTSLLSDADGAKSLAADRWSAGGYLWHVVDVIRFGTERLWTLAMDSATGIPGWDQDTMADVRHYGKLSTTVGLRALRVAVRDWVQAAEEAPEDARIEHPLLGSLTMADSIRRNAHEVQHHELDVRRALAHE